MRTLIFSICLFFFFPLLHAQNAELETLQKDLIRVKKLKNADSIATVYCHLSEYFAYRQSDSARYYCEEGLKYARSDKQEPYLTLLNNLAETFSALGEMDEAISRGLFTRKEAIRLNGNKSIQATILTSLGVAYRRKEMPDSALFYYNGALNLLESSEAYDEKAHLLTSMSILYANTARLKEAEFYVRRGVEAAKKCDDIDMVLYASTTAGGVMVLQKNYKEAVQMIYPALSMAREQRKPKFVLKSMTYLLNIFYKMDNKDSVDYYMKEADKVMEELPENSGEVLGHRETMFKILTKMKRYKESLLIQQLMLKAKDVNAQTPIDKLYLAMAQNYNGLKDYSNAIKYYDKAYQTADSLRQEEVNAELSELTVKYETQEKELEIARLTQEQLAQKAKTLQWGIIAAIAVFVCMLLSSFYIYHRRRIKKEEELKIAQSYIEGLERERTRLAKDLHDGVCNDLLGIGMQMQCMQPSEESKQELLGLLEQVRGEVRSISHELMPPKFQYVTLVEIVQAYVERLAIPDSMQLAFSEESDGTEWRQIPEQVSYEVYRIMQEVLSNIVKHSGAMVVSVNLSLSDKRLTLQISNNGKCFSDVATMANGIGLSTIQERVKAIGGVLSTNNRDEQQVFKLEILLSI